MLPLMRNTCGLYVACLCILFKKDACWPYLSVSQDLKVSLLGGIIRGIPSANNIPYIVHFEGALDLRIASLVVGCVPPHPPL